MQLDNRTNKKTFPTKSDALSPALDCINFKNYWLYSGEDLGLLSCNITTPCVFVYFLYPVYQFIVYVLYAIAGYSCEFGLSVKRKYKKV